MRPEMLKLFFFVIVLGLSNHAISNDNLTGISNHAAETVVQSIPYTASSLPLVSAAHDEETTLIDVDTHKMVFKLKKSVPQAEWILTAGDTIKKDLSLWAEKAGWNVVWNVPKDWVVPTNSVFSGEFQNAAEQVIKTLAGNGALVHAQLYLANKTMVVTGAPE